LQSTRICLAILTLAGSAFGTVRASAKGVARYLKTALGVLLGVLILGSLGAFLLYVPILPFAAVVIILLGLILMFVLGVQTGGRRIRVFRRKQTADPTQTQWIRLLIRRTNRGPI
jgi:hypothetical protein